MILWLIGISGAGKTTIGRLVVERLRSAGRSVIFIDGDEIREVWSDNLGHTLEDRRRNHTRLSKLCALLDQDGVDVVVSALSIFPDLRRWNRETFRSYVEVHIDTPIDVVSQRDPKKIYQRKMQTGEGFVVGIDMKFPVGTSDLTISGSESIDSPEVICTKIMDFLNQKIP